MKTHRIAISIPHSGTVHYHFMNSLFNLFSRLSEIGDIECALNGVNGSRISSNRNALVSMALSTDRTHILFIDSDMVFPSDALKRLLAHNKDIVCATASGRRETTPSTKRLENVLPAHVGTGKAIGSPINGVWEASGLTEMATVGCALMLIKMDVFQKIGMPAFYEAPNYESKGTMGEDEVFCHLARKNGFQVWCDVDLSKEIGHIGEKTFYITS